MIHVWHEQCVTSQSTNFIYIAALIQMSVVQLIEWEDDNKTSDNIKIDRKLTTIWISKKNA